MQSPTYTCRYYNMICCGESEREMDGAMLRNMILQQRYGRHPVPLP
jgi:hypothetical protein